MARDIIINGECMVSVKGNGALADVQGNTLLSQLGLAAKGIRITLTGYHDKMFTDDFGPHVPAELLWMLGDAVIEMDLVHYDVDILDSSWAESWAGGGLGDTFNPAGPVFRGLLASPGTLAGAGTPMGGGVAVGVAGNHYISLNLSSPVLRFPWRFPSAYLMDANVIPIGTKRSIAELKWRAIPYVLPKPPTVGTVVTTPPSGDKSEYVSKGAVLFDHTLDV